MYTVDEVGDSNMSHQRPRHPEGIAFPHVSHRGQHLPPHLNAALPFCLRPPAALPLPSQVDPQFYSFRWITLLLAQEFPLPDTLRIWDMILSDPHGRTDCLLRICTALILHVRERLMQGDFTVIMKTLQRYPPVDINVILQRAAALCPCREIP